MFLARAAALLALILPGAAAATPIPNPDQHTRLALAHLTTHFSWKERYYIRYISFWDTPREDLSDYRRYLNWWIQQLSFERAVTLPVEVPDADGRLIWIDIRWYGWNARSWRAVAERDPFTREPWVTFQAAEELRYQVGYENVRPSKDGTRPVLGMVRGAWWIRDTLETRRSPSYYDSLFARFRFPERRYEQGGKRYVQDLPFVDFPRDLADWEKAFGVDVIRSFGKEREVSLDYGAVVAGGRDHPEGGSIVTLHNRLIVINDVPFGKAMRTFDTLTPTGNKDYSEKLIFRGGKFKKGDGADAESDGGELLAYLPNGGMAGLLINGQGKRVETAVADIANDTADPILNQGVRNAGSCWVCHSPTGGFIPPRNLEELDEQAGIGRRFRDPDQARRHREFFFNWLESMEGVQKRYQTLIAKTTAPDYTGFLDFVQRPPKTWTGTDIAEMTGRIRREYDAPVDLKRAAREVGVPEGLAGYLCDQSPRHRAEQLKQGRSIPSETFEQDVFRELGLLLDAQRRKPDPAILRLYGHY